MMKELFQKRLSTFYNSLSFHKQDLWKNSDVVVIHSNQEKNSSNSQSNQFYLWLIGEELHDTTTIFTLYGIYFFSTQKNFSKIRSLCCSATLMQKIPVSVQLKGKNDEGFALIDATIRNERVIHNKKMFFDDVEDRCCPFVVGYIEGEYPKSKLFWNCINDLEPKKYKAVTLNSGIDSLINTAEKPNFDYRVFNEKEVSKLVEFTPPMPSFSHIVNVGKEKRSLKTKRDLRDKRESNLWSENDEKVFLKFLEDGNQSAPKTKENRFKFECKGSREMRSNLGSSIDKTEVLFGEGIEIKEKGESSKSMMSRVNVNRLPTTKTDEKVLLWMKNLNLSDSSSSGKQDKLRVPNIYGDQLFKFRGSWLDAKEDNSKEGNKNGDQLFKFGVNRLDGKGDKEKEGGINDDQPFTFGANRLDGKGDKAKEGGKNDDQLFAFGANRLDGKGDKAKEGGKSDDQLFKFGAKSLDGQEDKSKEGNKNGDQLFKFGGNWLDAKEDDKSKEGNKDGDQLFKSGEGEKDGGEDRLEEKSLLEKKGDIASSLLTDSSVDTKRPVEENKVFEKGNEESLTSKVEENKMFEGDNVETSTKEDGAEEKLLAEEQNMVCNPEKSNLLQEECEGRMDYTVQPTGVKDAASENSLPDDLNGSSRKDSVGSDREDDDWTLIEKESEKQETEVAEKLSWKRWFMDKTAKSFGLKDKVSDEAPSKED